MTGEPLHEEPSRRQWVGYWSMIVQQTQNAFNDKMAQFILIPLGGAVGFAVESWAGVMIALPFVLFAPLAGWLSDRFSKRDVMLGTAVAQLVILAWISLSVWMKQLPLALAGFFALAMQSAFFGPAKMGINKELVGSKHLGFATGIQQMTAMLAILVGQIVAGWWYDKRYTAMGGVAEHAWQAAMLPLLLLTVTAVPALFLSWIIPRVPAQGGAAFSGKVVVSHFVNLGELWHQVGLRRAACGVAFFWGIAAFINLWSVKLAKMLTGGGEGFGSLSSGFMAAASLGMAAGFGVASYLLRRRIELGWVPFAGAAMALCSLVIVWLPFDGTWFLGALAVLAFASALFLAPLNAWLQDNYPANKRGEFQAAVNLMDCMAGIIAVVVIEGFARVCTALGVGDAMSIRLPMLFAAAACLVATLAIARMLPTALLGIIGNTVMKTWYRLRVSHPERMPATGGVLVLPNHVSFIDACLLHAASPRRLRFVMEEQYASRGLIGFFSSLFDTVLIRRGQPLEAIRIVIDALQRGEAICYFPEGQLTRTGGLSPLQRGFELIAAKAGVPVVPVWIDGIWGSIFSYERGRFLTKVPYPRRLQVTVAVGRQLDARPIDGRCLQMALMEASSEAVALCFADEGRMAKFAACGGVAGRMVAMADRAGQRRAWINGHQIRMVNALQYGEPIHVWAGDPAWLDVAGVLVAAATGLHARLVVEDQVVARYGQVWIGGDALRDWWMAHPPGVPISFYDFGIDGTDDLDLDGVDHFPCLAIDGRVVALSMLPPAEVPAGFEPQFGSKPGARGRVLPGWALRTSATGGFLVAGPAAPDGLPLPAHWSVDADGFVVRVG